MAVFKIDGFDKLQVSVYDMATTPPETILSDVILPAAELMIEAMKDMITVLLHIRSGSLLNSIKVTRQGAGEGGTYAVVAPDQGHHPKSSTGKRQPRAQGGGGGSYSGTNAEVGFILEYGTSRIPGRHWIEAAVNDALEDIYAAMAAAWYAIIERKWAA